MEVDLKYKLDPRGTNQIGIVHLAALPTPGQAVNSVMFQTNVMCVSSAVSLLFNLPVPLLTFCDHPDLQHPRSLAKAWIHQPHSRFLGHSRWSPLRASSNGQAARLRRFSATLPFPLLLAFQSESLVSSLSRGETRRGKVVHKRVLNRC